MPDLFQPVLDDWSFPFGLTAILAVTALVYLRGWFALRRTRPQQFTVERLLSFVGGLAALWIAICSPLEALADALLSAHMAEHLILMSVVPPLVLLGLPVVPLLRGLPRVMQVSVVGPLMRFRLLRRLGHQMVRPRFAWLAMNLAFLGWHIPAAYDFALEHELWHDVEHLCFLGSSVLFWWCLIRPWPAARMTQRWTIVLYLLASDVVNTGLSAFLAFCGRPAYPYYVTHPNPLGIQPLPDQAFGAALMWVFGSTAFLVPAGAIVFELLQPASRRKVTRPVSARA